MIKIVSFEFIYFSWEKKKIQRISTHYKFFETAHKNWSAHEIHISIFWEDREYRESDILSLKSITAWMLRMFAEE